MSYVLPSAWGDFWLIPFCRTTKQDCTSGSPPNILDCDLYPIQGVSRRHSLRCFTISPYTIEISMHSSNHGNLLGCSCIDHRDPLWFSIVFFFNFEDEEFAYKSSTGVFNDGALVFWVSTTLNDFPTLCSSSISHPKETALIKRLHEWFMKYLLVRYCTGSPCSSYFVNLTVSIAFFP